MPITHAITHHLARLADAPAKLTLRPQELGESSPRDALLDQLKSSFLGRIHRQHGSFDAGGEPAALMAALDGFISDKQDFIQSSVALMKGLEQAIDQHNIVLNVHALFFFEQHFDNQVFYLFLAHQSESLAISDSLELTPSYAIDTGPSLFGIKVDIAEWKVRKNYAYLSLLPPRGNAALSGVFEQLCGFGKGIDKREATRSFLSGVEAFARELPDDSADEYRAKVVGYCVDQDRHDRPVSIRDLSDAIEGIDGERFRSTLASHATDANDNLLIDRRSLRQYIKFNGRERDIAISFSSNQLNRRVHYDAGSDTLTIRGLPKSLQTQLLAHLKGG